jgi:hypothetical protein
MFKDQIANLNKILEISMDKNIKYHLILLDGVLLERPDQIIQHM